MLAVSAVMYAVSAIHWTVNMAIAAKSLRYGTLLITPFETLVTVYLPTINVRHPSRLHLRRMLIAAKYILSDAIVVWRAWVVWGPSRRFTVFTPPILSLVCTLGEYKQIVGWFSRLTGPFVSVVGRWCCIRVPQ
jgi:hypothetical protein